MKKRNLTYREIQSVIATMPEQELDTFIKVVGDGYTYEVSEFGYADDEALPPHLFLDL